MDNCNFSCKEHQIAVGIAVLGSILQFTSIHPALHPYTEQIMMQSTAECWINTKGVYQMFVQKGKMVTLGSHWRMITPFLNLWKACTNAWLVLEESMACYLGSMKKMKKKRLGFIKKKKLGFNMKKKRLGFSLAFIHEQEELGIHEEEELRIQFVVMRLHLPLLSSGWLSSQVLVQKWSKACEFSEWVMLMVQHHLQQQETVAARCTWALGGSRPYRQVR